MNEQTVDLTSGVQPVRENILLGIIGAVLGVLLGAALWVFLGRIGFIAGIAGYAIVFCGMKGYELLGGHLSKGGIILCIILSFLAILAAEFVSLGITVHSELGEMYSLSMADSFRMVPELLKESELIGAVAKDLLFGYALSIWASYSSVKNIWRQTVES
ncbi:MAG: hypothetical protein HFH74_01920 [Lachnospiraceae bacterium]|jgi:hypothetical protein|nr:hypothetical protein [Lachnospiraceae bacterium]